VRAYARIGGRSPILELTKRTGVGGGRALGNAFRVYVGMRHWHPYIQDVVEEIARAGHRRIVGVAMAPHYSNMSVGAYENLLGETVRREDDLYGGGPKTLASACAMRLATRIGGTAAGSPAADEN